MQCLIWIVMYESTDIYLEPYVDTSLLSNEIRRISDLVQSALQKHKNKWIVFIEKLLKSMIGAKITTHT